MGAFKLRCRKGSVHKAAIHYFTTFNSGLSGLSYQSIPYLNSSLHTAANVVTVGFGYFLLLSGPVSASLPKAVFHLQR